LSISLIILTILFVASFALYAPSFTDNKIFDISSVEFLLCSANFLISSATTAKPFPASPALAASIAAFKANKLVCSVILFIVSTMSPIF